MVYCSRHTQKSRCLSGFRDVLSCAQASKHKPPASDHRLDHQMTNHQPPLDGDVIIFGAGTSCACKSRHCRRPFRPACFFLVVGFFSGSWEVKICENLQNLKNLQELSFCYDSLSILISKLYRKLTYPLKIDGWKIHFPFDMVPFWWDINFYLGVIISRWAPVRHKYRVITPQIVRGYNSIYHWFLGPPCRWLGFWELGLDRRITA